MLDTCTIRRDAGTTWDENAGRETKNSMEIYGNGKCRIKAPSLAAQDIDAGSQLQVLSALELHLPLSAEDVRVGDIAEIIGSTTRVGQVGRFYRIAAPFDGSQTTALRFHVEVTDVRY